MEDPWIYYEEPRRSSVSRGRFSRTEIRDILIAMLVLSVAFTAIMYRGSNLSNNEALNLLYIFGLSLVLVSTGFLLHELAHKFVAQRYGAWAEFRMYPMGLVMALMFSIMGFLFAAPGAVYIDGNINVKKNGIISVAGPLVNLIAGGIAFAVMFATDGLLSDIARMFAFFNVFLAFFNLLPIYPMDGSKIFKWNPPIYVCMMAIAVLGLLTLYGIF